MAQQQHYRGPEARKVELERRLDENEKTVSRGLASSDTTAKRDKASGRQQQSDNQSQKQSNSGDTGKEAP